MPTCASILRQPDNERHFTDLTIRRLIERGGVMGVLPFGKFIRPGWSASDDPSQTTLDHLLAHIDAICQIAGDARHVGLGTDFDGGFGWPHVPCEIDTIADLQKLDQRLRERGYSAGGYRRDSGRQLARAARKDFTRMTAAIAWP